MGELENKRLGVIRRRSSWLSEGRAVPTRRRLNERVRDERRGGCVVGRDHVRSRPPVAAEVRLLHAGQVEEARPRERVPVANDLAHVRRRRGLAARRGRELLKVLVPLARPAHVEDHSDERLLLVERDERGEPAA